MPEKGYDTCEELAEENVLLRFALESCQSWIERWTKHVGSCEGGDKCTCGRTAVLHEASAILAQVR